MRTATALAMVAGIAVVGNATVKPTAEDLVSVSLTSVVAGVHHVGLVVPDKGLLRSLLWTTTTVGSGAGTAVYEVVRSAEVLCAVTVPCEEVLGGHAEQACSAVLNTGEHLDVRPSTASNCSLLPQGTLTLSFRWR